LWQRLGIGSQLVNRKHLELRTFDDVAFRITADHVYLDTQAIADLDSRLATGS